MPQDGPEEWESDGQLGSCWPEAMGAFYAANHTLQAAMAEPIEGEAKIHVPGMESIELVLDTVEGAGLGCHGPRCSRGRRGPCPRRKRSSVEGVDIAHEEEEEQCRGSRHSS